MKLANGNVEQPSVTKGRERLDSAHGLSFISGQVKRYTHTQERIWFRVSSARRSQQSGLRCQGLVLLDVVLLEAHGDPLGHLQVLLQTRLRASELR